MKNIIHIFRKDVRGLCRNFFALVIAIGLCFIPSLYAWFNIYSNEDPYANTGNIYIAVADKEHFYHRCITSHFLVFLDISGFVSLCEFLLSGITWFIFA